MKQRITLSAVLAAMLLSPVVAQSGDVLGGAAKGAVIGGIAGDAGKGAAAGAVGSPLFGEMRRNR